jgi:hypothetical protein
MSFTLPTEIVELPSKGLLYPEGHPLANGEIEIKYMTAKEEDILSNSNYIQNGTVLDKLLESVIITNVNMNDLLIGDKNAVMVASRILGYGGEYKFMYKGEEQTVDLSQVESKPIDETWYTRGLNEFEFTLPATNTSITFKLLTHGDEVSVTKEVEGLKKINKNASNELTLRLKRLVTSVNGSRDTKEIREFIDNYMLARDSRALREHIRKIQPDVDLTFFPRGSETRVDIPIGLSFFWPDI